MNTTNEVIEIMDGIEAREFWHEREREIKEKGEKYDFAIDDKIWLVGYLKGLWN